MNLIPKDNGRFTGEKVETFYSKRNIIATRRSEMVRPPTARKKKKSKYRRKESRAASLLPPKAT